VRVGWSLITLGVLVLGGCIAVALITSGTFFIVLPVGSVMISRGVSMRGNARAPLAQIRSTPALPAAKVRA